MRGDKVKHFLAGAGIAATVGAAWEVWQALTGSGSPEIADAAMTAAGGFSVLGIVLLVAAWTGKK